MATDVGGLALLVAASAVAGAINSVAGGGSLISFPAALAVGLPPVTANATNALALVPGSLASAWAYHGELAGKARLALGLTLPAATGSAIGAGLLLGARPEVFEAVVPVLVLGATGTVLFKDLVARFADAPETASTRRRLALGAALGAIAIYGGYFGAGIGIMLLAAFAVFQRMSLNEMNGLKCVIAAAINGVAAAYFVTVGAAALPEAATMAVGSSVGGYAGARVARRFPVWVLKAVIACTGVSLSVVLVARLWFLK
ncbi:MAG TPA: sulfite exporter TauE/SafE family protein [Polyangiaceae bacterium]